MSRIKPHSITAPAQRGTKVFEYIGIGMGLVFVGILLLGGAYYVVSSSKSAGGLKGGSTTTTADTSACCGTTVAQLDPLRPTDINPGGAYKTGLKHPAGCIYVQRAAWTEDTKVYGPFCPTDGKGKPSNTAPNDIEWAWSEGKPFSISVTLMP